MLLWACKKYCCCIYNIHEITPYSIHVSPRSRSIQVELGKVEIFWSTLRTATTSTSHIFECWAESSLATDSGENKSAVPCDDVSRSDWVRPIRLRHLELHARTLYLSYFLQNSKCSTFHECMTHEPVLLVNQKIQQKCGLIPKQITLIYWLFLINEKNTVKV